MVKSWVARLVAVVLGVLIAVMSASVSASYVKPFKITMVLFRGCEQACQGFRDYISGSQIPVQIEMLDCEMDLQRIPAFVEKIKQNKPDLLVTWGTTVSLDVLGTVDGADPAKHVTDVPALFMIASTPVGSGLVRSLNDPGRNVSGTLYMVPVETQIKVARTYMPFKRVGFILNPTENNSLVALNELRSARTKYGFELIERTVPLTVAGKPDPTSLKKIVNQMADDRIDFLYFAPDTFLLLNRNVITGAAVERKLPVLATSESVVQESQALFGVVNHYYTVGQLTASKAEMILSQKIQPKDIPVVAPPGFALIVNMRVAALLNEYPPFRVIKMAEFVR